MMTDGDGPTWTRRIYERHLDLLLAEEAECNPLFTRWLINRRKLGATLPTAEPSVIVHTGFVDVDHLGTASFGEDDLRIVLTWNEPVRTAVILVEDKIDAELQPYQVKRYEGRIADLIAGGTPSAGIFIAPEEYIVNLSTELGQLIPVSIEDIARRLNSQASLATDDIARRLRWRASRIVQIIESRRATTPDHPPTIALRDWICRRLESADPHIRPRLSSLRTKSTTWLYFEHPSALVLKVGHRVVDIYLRVLHPGNAEAQRQLWDHAALPDGFTRERDTRGNLIFRWGTWQLRPLDSLWRDDQPLEVEFLDEALAACARASRWIAGLSPSGSR